MRTEQASGGMPLIELRDIYKATPHRKVSVMQPDMI